MPVMRVPRLLCASLLAAVLGVGTARAAVSPADASRFLTQATLGADWEEIQRTSRIGYDAWLRDQFSRPIGYHQPLIDERLRMGLEVTPAHGRWAWWQEVLDGPDPLRQRVALALSEIFVVTDVDGTV